MDDTDSCHTLMEEDVTTSLGAGPSEALKLQLLLCPFMAFLFSLALPLGNKTTTKKKDESLKLPCPFFISPPMQYVVASCHHLSAHADSALLPQCKLLAAV